MAAGFSVKDALNKNSKAGIDESPKARFRTKDISIFKMYRNEMNFYSVEQIEELAGDILMYGLKQNLELVYAPCEKGEYRIVAGERRWEALKYLVSNGYKEFEIATSKLTTPQDDDDEQVEIIIANAYRTKSITDLIEEETRLKTSLERMRAAGKKVKGYDLQSGRLRDVIASMLHISKTKVAQFEAVNNNLISEWKEELKKGQLTFSAAYELSGMSTENQREALGKFVNFGEISLKDIKDMKEEQMAEKEKAQLQGQLSFYDIELVSESDTKVEAKTIVSESDTEVGAKTIVSESDTEMEAETIVSESDTEMEAKKIVSESDTKMEVKKVVSECKKYIRLFQHQFDRVLNGTQHSLIIKENGYQVNDKVVLGEFIDGRATGRTIEKRITFIENEISGLERGYCVIEIF
ncbi:MAG: DUF3850 domain-containing protein [Lachnospiraceae bacterium]|nr:DUF3850 domain-containing protein [Lachnospiraceae bacterium]